MAEFEERRFHHILHGFVNLTAQARNGQLAPTFGRDATVERAMQALEGGHTVILSGMSGVGKSATWREIARRIHDGHAPAALGDLEIFLASVAQLQQGCVYAGWWEQKLFETAAEVAERGRAGTRALIVVTDFGNLFRVSRTSRNDEKVIADDFLNYLEAGQLWVAGELTPELARPGFADDPRWVGRTRVIELPPLSGPPLFVVLRQLAAERERGPDARPDATRTAHDPRTLAAWREGKPGAAAAERMLERAVQLGDRFLPHAVQPGAALRLMESAAELGALDAAGIEAAASKETGVPLALVSDAIPLPHTAIAARLSERVIGQALAVGAVADTVALVKAGLNDPRRPLGVLLFTGPSGTGKTELAKAIAALLFGDERAILRCDMSEYFGANSAERFSAELVKRVASRPISVVLLDEVEKADIAAHDILLQVCSDGVVTHLGRPVSLRQSLIIMTANLGVGGGRRPLPDVVGNAIAAEGPRTLGFASPERRAMASPTAIPPTIVASADEAARDAVAERFRPEFVGRIDQIIAFRPLGPDAVRRIVARELDRALMHEGFARRNILVEYDERLVALLAAHGADDRYGARPLVQAIKQTVVVPLARWLAAAPATRDRLLRLSEAHGELLVRNDPLAIPGTEGHTGPPPIQKHGLGGERVATLPVAPAHAEGAPP